MAFLNVGVRSRRDDIALEYFSIVLPSDPNHIFFHLTISSYSGCIDIGMSYPSVIARQYGPSDAPIIVYGYVPSPLLAISGIIIFFIAFVSQISQLLLFRNWYFTPLVVGTVMEVVGYVFRALSSQVNPYNIIFFVGQYFCTTVAPVILSITIYAIINVMINIFGKMLAPFPPKVILFGFIAFDVVATVLQVAGAASVGKAYRDKTDPTRYNKILLAGLAFQVFTFLCFIICMSSFVFKAWAFFPTKIRRFVVAFGAATLCIYLRTCFRLAETAEGLRGYLSTHEVYFGCLEFLPIVLVVILLGVWYPGRYLRSRDMSGSLVVNREETEMSRTGV